MKAVIHNNESEGGERKEKKVTIVEQFFGTGNAPHRNLPEIGTGACAGFRDPVKLFSSEKEQHLSSHCR